MEQKIESGKHASANASATGKKLMNKDRICFVEGCDQPVVSKGMCNRHYKQVRRTGAATPGKELAPMSIGYRFWRHVEKRVDAECWPWIGCKDKDGYGVLKTNGAQTGAHRVSYQIHKGEIPAGLIVRHKCNNPTCVNPSHLDVGTHLDNTNDMRIAGRMHCKFSDDVVAAVRAATGSNRQLAAIFGVSETHVARLRRGEGRLPVERAA